MPRFDRNKRYVNRKGQRFGKGVWYDDNGKILQPGFGRFEDSSRIDRTVTQYNTDGTISTFSWEDWVKKNGIDHELRVLQNDRKYAIPFIPDKKVTISIDKNSPTRKNDGAVFSENLLDSIAINAKKAGLSFGDALGIVAQESTFGNGNHRGTGQTLLPWLPVLNQSSGEQKDKAEKMPYQGFQSPSLLISNWKQREENPYAEFFYDGKGDVLHTSKSKEYYDEYFRPHLVKGNRYHLQEESPLQHGFRNYKEHPKSWNYGDSDYQNKITVQKKELTQYSPEIREYMRKHGLHAYGGPLVEQANMFEIGGPKKKLSDKEYYSIMEKVAENNNPIWNSQRIKNGGRPLSVDEEYLRILNDNTYDYRGFYDNNPIDAADASTHWPDSYKTVYHPTFSTYSDYSGKVSDFNPLGLEGGTWPKGPTEAREEDFIPAWWQSIPNAYTGRQHDEGGSLNAYKSWDNLSIKEKSEMMKVAIRNGITNLADIKAKYNEFAEGGYMTSEEDDDVNMYDGISQTSQQMQQRYIYDILPRLYAMDGVNVVLSSGLRPNAVVYQNGKPTGRKSRHGSGQAADIVPVKGTTFADIFRVLHDPNSNVSRWMRANNAGYVDETSATGTTKYWHDHNRDHSHVHHQIGGNPASQYAARFGNSVSSVGNYRDIAKQHIRQNEGWSATPYADGPNGWRSVGYGFNDSGFRAKYPGGIANYYAQRGGITKAEAERELDWFLNNMEASLRKTYGRRWDSFSDNQKAAIMDTAYQRPASVDAKSAFYAAVMSGNPNAGNLLGVKGFDKRNADRRNLFSSSAVQAMNPQNYGQQQPQMAYNPFEGWEPMNPQAFYGNPEQMGVIEQLAQQNAQMQAILDKQEADRLLAVQQQAEAEEKALQRNRTNLALQMVGMMGSDDGSSEFDMLRPLSGNMSAYGGNIYGLGDWLKRAWKKLNNSAQVAAIAENPAVMTAAGHKINRQGKVEYNHANDLGVRQLRNNLLVLGENAAIAPTLVNDIGAVATAVRHPIRTVKAVGDTAKAVGKAVKKRGTKAIKKITEPLGEPVVPNGYTGLTPKVIEYSRNTPVEPPTFNFNEAKDVIDFKSELDWAPKSWFEDTVGRHYSDGSPTEYTDIDIANLKSNIPEYTRIEREAKNNGTWLQMPDGSTWEGDPRSWVQYMSSAAQEHNPSVFWTGIHGWPPEAPIIPSDNGQIWGIYGMGKLPASKARTYAIQDENVLPMFYDNSIPTTQYDVAGDNWFRISNLGDRSTDDIVNFDFQTGSKAVKIDNVKDSGSNFVPDNSLYYTEEANNPMIPQNDIILSKGVLRKSLLGSDGMFRDPNHIFRSVAPLTLGASASGYPLIQYLETNR